MKVVQHMAPKATAKSSNFTAVIRDEDYVEALTDYQWANRLTRPELVRAAIDFFAEAKGIKLPTVEEVEIAAADEAEAADKAEAAEEVKTEATTARRR